jgi:hypothetical protein
MIRLRFLILLTLLAAACHTRPPTPEVANSCLALSYGIWTPPLGRWHPSHSLAPNIAHHIRLTPYSSPYPCWDRPWWRVEEFGGTEEAPALWWRAPAPDSLVLWRGGGPSWGFEAAGTWAADTLIGPAHTWTDVRTANEPHATVYLVRFDCTRAGEAAADAAVLRLAVQGESTKAR